MDTNTEGDSSGELLLKPSLKNPVPAVATTGFEDFWKGGSESMTLSEKQLRSVERKGVNIFNRRKTKRLIPV